MTYSLLIHKDADKVLRKMDRTVRNRIAEKIQALGDNPDDPLLDIQPLTGTESLPREALWAPLPFESG